MLRIFSFISILIISCLAIDSGFAASSQTGTGTQTGVISELSAKSVKVLDSKTIRVNFSENIDISSLVLKVAKQSDNSAVTVADMTGVVDMPESVDVILDTDLEEGSSYTLTVLAAVGISGSTIVDGAGALREFVTPSPLKKAGQVFNAPPNPSAVLAETGKAVTETPVVKKLEVVPPPVKETPAPTEELPLTGMNPLFFLLIAFPIAYLTLRRKA